MGYPFKPCDGSTVSLSVTSVSSNAYLGSISSSTFLLTNPGSSLCYTRFGVSGVAATIADLPLLPNSAIVVSRNAMRDLYLAAITDSGSTTTLKGTPGNGE